MGGSDTTGIVVGAWIVVTSETSWVETTNRQEWACRSRS